MELIIIFNLLTVRALANKRYSGDGDVGDDSTSRDVTSGDQSDEDCIDDDALGSPETPLPLYQQRESVLT